MGASERWTGLILLVSGVTLAWSADIMTVEDGASTVRLRISDTGATEVLANDAGSPALKVDNTLGGGALQIVDGSQGVGKILVSDAAGLASWQPPSASAGGWTDSGTTVHLTSATDRVGIGTPAPTGTLHVVGGANAVPDGPGSDVTIQAQDGGPDGGDPGALPGKAGDILLLPGTGTIGDVIDPTLGPYVTNVQNPTFGLRIDPADILTGGTEIRLTFEANVSAVTINNTWIGKRGAGSFDFDGAQVRVTFDGGNAGTGSIPAGARKTSDWIPFAIDPAQSYVVRHDHTSGDLEPSRELGHTNKGAFTQNQAAAGATSWTPASTNDVWFYVDRIQVRSGNGGNVGVGTTTPSAKLEVAGGDIRVTGGSFIDDGTTLSVPDYVFEEGYRLMPLSELRAYIGREKHLPGVPAASVIRRKGLNLGAFQLILLKKIEELTLHTLAQQDRLEQLELVTGELRRALASRSKRSGRAARGRSGP